MILDNENKGIITTLMQTIMKRVGGLVYSVRTAQT